MAQGSSLVGHTNADSVLTVHTYCHMLGAKTSPENLSSNLFPNISCFTVLYTCYLIYIHINIYIYTHAYIYIYIYTHNYTYT